MRYLEVEDAETYAELMVIELGKPHDCNSEVILDRDLKPFKYTEVFNGATGETKGIFVETGEFKEKH